jgi:hypothetical protein
MNHPKITRACPFCGAGGTELTMLREKHISTHLYVFCLECQAQGPPTFVNAGDDEDSHDRELAVNRWNQWTNRQRR